MARRVLVRGGTVVTNDRATGEVVGGDVLIDGTRVLSAGPPLGEVVDAMTSRRRSRFATSSKGCVC